MPNSSRQQWVRWIINPPADVLYWYIHFTYLYLDCFLHAVIYFVHCASSLIILFYICACCDTRCFKKVSLFLFVEVKALLGLCYMLYNIRHKIKFLCLCLWVCLQFVIVVFLGHTHLLFLTSSWIPMNRLIC